MIRLAMAATLIAAALPQATAQAGSQPVPGFKITLVGEGAELTPECSLSRGVLSCWGVGKLPKGASCDFGGTVPTVKITRRGRAKQSYVCMDEGFHDWQILGQNRTWRSGRFRCRARWIGGDMGYARLSCQNGNQGFHVRPDGSWKRF